MTREDFLKAFEIAQSDADLQSVDVSIFDGFGLPGFGQVHVTIRSVARLIRWQARMFDGEWDAKALNEVAVLGRHRFVIID